ncbi:ABC transporter permease [Ekhidna sp. To15]|uniref:ABC transporter permease n=1 Tax=Ekhidna sp. To15 TaxID=3395267 RepID=UPI003F5259D0
MHPEKEKSTWGDRILRFFTGQQLFDEVKGDLEETYHWRQEQQGKWYAGSRYYWDLFSASRFMFSSGGFKLISQSLLFSFIKSSFRNFRRNLGYTSLNILGLALGLSAALFILEYVSEELNYNNSSGSAQIYRVSNDYYRFGEKVYESSMTFSGVGPAMERDIPEVTEYARLFSSSIQSGAAVVLTRPDQPQINFKEQRLFFADSSYLDFFDLTVTHGVSQLDKPNTIMLTAELAEKYFGSIEQALGKTLKYNDNKSSHELIVSGVFTKPDFKLQVDTDVLISYGTLVQQNEEVFTNDWGGNAFITFVKVTEQASPHIIEQAMSELTLRYKPGYSEKNEQGEYLRVNRYFLTRITDIHLNSDYQNEVGPVGDATTIRVLQVIALFIVIIAWINFINLSTAKSVDRAREVGVRKVMGAHKNELVMQFFTEAILINGLAVLLALAIVMISQPLFNMFVEKRLSLLNIDTSRFGMLAVIIFLIGTTLSGLYPAFVISAHKAIDALKGKSKVDAGLYLRRGLIAFQLLFSSLLIMATLAINGQLKYMNNHSMGFDMDEVLILRGPVIRPAIGEENIPNIELFKQQVLAIAGVSHISTSSVIPGQGILRGLAISRIRESEADMKSIERVVTSNHFLTTMKVRFIAGRDFDKEMVGYAPIILNVSAAKMLGFDDPSEAMGQILYEFTREERKVVGVIEDYHHESLSRAIDAMYFVRNEAWDAFYAVRLDTKEMGTTLERIEEQYKAAYPGNPADYYFLDQFFGTQYKKDEVNRKVFSAFALMAIIVACLGLYGLSSFSALQRTKEVGVRKVLGASIPGLFMLLSKETFILVLLGFVLAIPMAWLGIESWLNGFAYRMPIEPLLFVTPLVLISAITLVATGSRILKVALANPVNSLRYE